MNYKAQAKKVIDSVIDRKGYACCEMCGRVNTNLHCHHLIYRSERPTHPELHNIRNLILVCSDGISWRGCHEKLHANKSLRSQLVKERKLKELFAI